MEPPFSLFLGFIFLQRCRYSVAGHFSWDHFFSSMNSGKIWKMFLDTADAFLFLHAGDLLHFLFLVS